MASTVTVTIHSDGAQDICKSEGVRAELLRQAQSIASSASSKVPSSKKTFDNPDFIAKTVTLDHTVVGRVSAANPRSDWYAKKNHLLDI